MIRVMILASRSSVAFLTLNRGTKGDTGLPPLECPSKDPSSAMTATVFDVIDDPPFARKAAL